MRGICAFETLLDDIDNTAPEHTFAIVGMDTKFLVSGLIFGPLEQ